MSNCKYWIVTALSVVAAITVCITTTIAANAIWQDDILATMIGAVSSLAVITPATWRIQRRDRMSRQRGIFKQ